MIKFSEKGEMDENVEVEKSEEDKKDKNIEVEKGDVMGNGNVEEVLDRNDVFENEMEGIKSVNILDTLLTLTIQEKSSVLADITLNQIPQAIAAYLSRYPGLQQKLRVMPTFNSGKENSIWLPHKQERGICNPWL